jgi:hypothetical protein
VLAAMLVDLVLDTERTQPVDCSSTSLRADHRPKRAATFGMSLGDPVRALARGATWHSSVTFA